MQRDLQRKGWLTVVDFNQAGHGPLVEVLLVDEHAHSLKHLHHVRSSVHLGRHVVDDRVGQGVKEGLQSGPRARKEGCCKQGGVLETER